MQALQINLSIDGSLFTKDPESSDLGKKIVRTSIEMIDELGYEAFTFKKLGDRIHSNESSIYRYFESKHALLVYLFNWYWSWIEYKLVFLTMNIEKPEVKLVKILRLLTEEIKEDSDFSSINEVLLNKIIISESAKAYHNKEVDEDNKKGFFKVYKRVVQRVCDIILEINPNYPYPHMLISTIIEGAHHQRFFSEHLPSLTDVEEGNDAIDRFYEELLLKAIKTEV
ncbi:MAG: TetR/AcrR family transcriptional regulator [Flavobacteriaceae bacterium]|jgi:AcrR family transcriptional regulator|nr:TetR/AcrR family transcriptional regulator [Bacteroidota bacterium]MDA0922468.1 TetR/AcrR family transcriptional regulator [Bacteroidota bacterium]MDA1288561.1 TetR/AcrR family transcriptional regulator [Bacteroidota bacterium]